MWKMININKQQVKAESQSCALIAMPHSSSYDGYCFWFPSKLIRDGRHSNALSLSYNDSFIFKLYKYGKGKYNKHEIISEEEIDVDEFEEAFGIIDQNIKAHGIVNEFETHKPEEIDPVKVEVLEELKDE